MSVKKIEVANVGTVALYKRRGARNVRLSISHTGEVRITLPFWAPYKVGIDFVKSKAEWIAAQKPPLALLEHGYRIGKAHHIHFEAGSGATASTRISGNQVRILLPVGIRWDSPEAQQAAVQGGIRALKKEARQLLPRRLKLLADTHGYTFSSVAVKQLKGRWGSCSERQDIVLNCFLMQLPWELIDYVLLHELAHTKVMAHGTLFWEEMERTLPDVKQLRKMIKAQKPTL